MEKELYTISEMVQIGFSKKALVELAHCKQARRFSFRKNDKPNSPFLFNRKKLEEYLKERS